MLEPKYSVLQTLFADRVFRIPHYQRYYSWRSRQREDLFADLRKLAPAADQHHFMATLVCCKTSETRKVGVAQYRIFDVVDGQQRLTTLILLLKCIELALAPDTLEHRELHALIVKADNQLILLQSNNANERIFNRFLRDGLPPQPGDLQTRSDENLATAIKECQEFAATWQEDRELADLMHILMQRLGFVVYDTEDERAVYTVFEVLNSRGLPVEWLDKCKSVLMGRAYDLAESNEARAAQMDSLQKDWAEIYRVIARKDVDGDDVLRITATLFHAATASKPRSAEDSLELLRARCNAVSQPGEISGQLLEIAQKLTTLAEDAPLGPVTDIFHSRMLAVAILLAKGLIDSDRELLMEQWERTTFRIFGLHGKDARNKVGEYVRLATQIVQGDETVRTCDQILQALYRIGADCPIDPGIATGLAGRDCYTADVDLCRYVLWRYEEHLTKAVGANATLHPADRSAIWRGTATDTVEHIFPQSGETAAAWKNLMRRGSGAGQPVEDHVGRIGNLMLLPKSLNSQARTKPFAAKKDLYRQHNLRSVQEVVQAPQWTLTEIEEREKRILEWAKRRWADV